MKTHLYYLITIIALVVGIFMLYDRLHKAESESDKYAQVITEQQAEIEYRKNREGRLIAAKDAAELTTQQFIKSYPKIVEELKHEFDVKMRDVKAYVRNEFEARGTGNSIVHNHYDSTGSQVTSLKVDDGYLRFQATVYDSANAPYEYVYSDTVSTVIHTERKWIFGKETLKASTMFKNPNARSVKMTNLVVNNHRDKRWTVGPVVYWDPLQQNYGVAVAAGYALVKF